jgi:cytidine diphosphoramidate kinase
VVIWITGISGAGKTTLGSYFFKYLKKKKINSIFLDGDETRKIFFGYGKYSLNDRDLHAIKLTNLVKYLSDQNINIIISANITSQKYRNWCKKNIKFFLEVFIDASLDELLKRDYKKLYYLALKKKIKNVVGVDIPFKKPIKPHLVIKNSTSKKNLFKNILKINKEIKKRKLKIF